MYRQKYMLGGKNMDQVKIIISDLDGTLLNDEEIVSEKTIHVIRKLKEQGYLFGFATGRPIISVERLLSRWKMNQKDIDFVVGLNGGHVKDYSLNIEKFYFQMEGNIIKKIIHHFQGFPVNYGVYKKDFLGVYQDDDLAKRLSKSDGIPYQVIDFQNIFLEKQSKLIVICNPQDMPKIKEHGDKLCIENIKSIQAGKIEYEYMNNDLSKTYGIQQLCSWHGCTLENVIAFGDADNDADMIKNVGIGIAMENASSLTKSAAKDFTASNNDDGVAKYLEENLLKSKKYGINFQQMNECEYQVFPDNTILFKAPPRTDYFVDPINDQVNVNAPFLYHWVSGDFIFRVKVKPHFIETYDACVLLAYDHERLWAKACYELTDLKTRNVVSVMTNEYSDDANGPLIYQEEIWLQIVRKGHMFGIHYSLDGKTYQMVRLTYLPMNNSIKVGIVAQSPCGEGGEMMFSNMSIVEKTIDDVRNGNCL